MPRTMRELIIQPNTENSTINQKTRSAEPRRGVTIAITMKLGTTSSRSTIHIRRAIAPAAEVAGDRSDRRGEDRRDERHADADQHRLLHTSQRQRQQILAERVGAEPVVGAGRLLQRVVVQIGVAVGQQRRQGVTADEEQHKQCQRHHGGFVA